MAYLLSFRLVLIWVFRNQMDPGSTWRDILAVVLNGSRYDSVVASYFIAIPLVLSLASLFTRWRDPATTVRRIASYAFVTASSFLCMVTFSYFAEFGDQFNHFLFGLYYDDFRATMPHHLEGVSPH